MEAGTYSDQPEETDVRLGAVLANKTIATS